MPTSLKIIIIILKQYLTFCYCFLKTIAGNKFSQCWINLKPVISALIVEVELLIEGWKSDNFGQILRVKSIILCHHFKKYIIFVFILTSLPHKSCWFQDNGTSWSWTLNISDWKRLCAFQVNLSVITSIFYLLYNTHFPSILKLWIRNMSACWGNKLLLFFNSIWKTFFQVL